MSTGAPFAEVLAAVEVVQGPTGRDNYLIVCPKCGNASCRIRPWGDGTAIAGCSCTEQYFVEAALQDLVRAKSNGDGRANGGGQDAPAKRPKTTKAGSDERLKELRAALVEVENEEGERVEDWLRFQARCVERFGPGAGLLLRQLTFLTGLSTKLSGGWFYKSRAELRRETGLGNSDIRKARRILTGQKPYGGYGEVRVLEEYEPPKRAPMQYRVDLETLALALDAGDSEGAS